MAGYVIYNGFWNAVPSDPVKRLIQAAGERGVLLTPMKNTQLTAGLDGGVQVTNHGGGRLTEDDYALFWDKDIRLARAMEACGIRLYNSADTVEICDDKAATQLRLAKEGIPMPETLVAPMTYREIDSQIEGFLRLSEEKLGYPMVVKECYGSLGGQVYLAETSEQLRNLALGMGSRPFMTQRFVASSAGRDLRLYVVGGRVAAAMERRSKTDFRANIGNGGYGTAHIPTVQEEALALDCCRILGADFAGVDLLYGADDSPLVCEVNSNAYMEALTACTGVDVAGVIMDYVLAKEAGRR